nr:MAG TPA: hypothetical protein [Caudoviricetes sp.]
MIFLIIHTKLLKILLKHSKISNNFKKIEI